MDEPRRFLRGGYGGLWVLASLALIVFGLVRESLRQKLHHARSTAVSYRHLARESTETLLAMFAVGRMPLEAGGRPRLLARDRARIEGVEQEMREQLAGVDRSWDQAEQLLRDGQESAAVGVYRSTVTAAADLSWRNGERHARVRRLLEAGALARAGLSAYDYNRAGIVRRLEETEGKDVPGLRDKYRLPDEACRFRLPEARELLRDADAGRRQAQQLLDTAVEPEGIPDEPEALKLAERAASCLAAVQAAAEKRLASSLRCNELYDEVRARLAAWPERRAVAEAALRVLWASYLPKYREGLPEQLEGVEKLRPEIEWRLTAEIERYQVQDFDGALALLDAARGFLDQADAGFAAAPAQVARLEHARAACPTRIAEAQAAADEFRAYSAAHAGDAGSFADPQGLVSSARAREQGEDWLEALERADTAVRQARLQLDQARQRVAAAAQARAEASRRSTWGRSSDSDTSSIDWSGGDSSGSDWGGGGSSDSGGSWGDSGSDTGW